MVRQVPNAETKILVNKDDHKSTGITGFAKVIVSPDNLRFCFEAWPPAPAPALYISDIEGTEVTKIGENYKNCTWSSDGAKLAYINSAAQDKPANIFVYDIVSGKEKNITLAKQTEAVKKAYGIIGLSADSTKLLCNYTILNTVTTEEEKTEGTCEVDWKTLAITEEEI